MNRSTIVRPLPKAAEEQVIDRIIRHLTHGERILLQRIPREDPRVCRILRRGMRRYVRSLSWDERIVYWFGYTIFWLRDFLFARTSARPRLRVIARPPEAQHD